MVEYSGRIERFENAAHLWKGSAQHIVKLLRDAVRRQGIANIALSGGSTPKAVYALLSMESFRSQVEWDRVHFFWGDERCVPPDHPESNYRMTYEVLLSAIAVPDAHIHRIEAERQPEEAAQFYERELQRHFGVKNNDLPAFDVMLLGLGEDGHTASLFPGTPILGERRRLVAEVFVPPLRAHRISMTVPTINHSRTILFLVSGESKREILRDVLNGEPERFPAQMICPHNGELRWLVDEQASSLLSIHNEQQTFRQ